MTIPSISVFFDFSQDHSISDTVLSTRTRGASNTVRGACSERTSGIRLCTHTQRIALTDKRNPTV